MRTAENNIRWAVVSDHYSGDEYYLKQGPETYATEAEAADSAEALAERYPGAQVDVVDVPVITVSYSSVDGHGDSREFTTIEAARKFAHKMVGDAPEYGGSYAVSGDGVGRVTWEGTTGFSLFPRIREDFV
jgi:hypothetical protein